MSKKIEIECNDIVEMKKEHPCGSREWQVYKMGMDIGLACRGCGKKVRIPRSKFNSMFKKHIRRGNQ